MAIVFTQELDSSLLLKAYNNNIIRFYGDAVGKVATKANIEGLGFTATIYPNPQGSFYFNFKDYSSAAVNTQNFKDYTNYVLDVSDTSSVLYDVTDGYFIKGEISITVFYDDQSEEASSFNYSFLASVTQINTFNQDKIENLPQQFDILAPAINRADKTFLKMWKGYPFEFSLYQFVPAFSQMENLTNGGTIVFTPTTELTSLVLSDGLNTFAELGLGNGYNKFKLIANDVEMPNSLYILYDEFPECGVYVKFLNRFGRFNYWLFSKEYFETRSSKQIGEIENDFNNIEQTQSPTLQLGKISDSTLRVAAKRVEPELAIILDEIFDSPKIMIFSGIPGDVNTNDNWYETRLKTSSFEIHAANKKIKNYFLEFDQPIRNTITL